MKNFDYEKTFVLLTGFLLGVFSVLLSLLGNPHNTGICVSCFMENIAGALGLHNNARMQYIRPEIIGFMLGAFIIAIIRKEFNARKSENFLIHFILGIILMIGAAVFVGCPIKLMNRIGSGELAALFGLFGLLSGIWIGIQFLKNGFNLGEAQETSKINGLIMPIFMLILLVFIFIKPAFVFFSSSGPGSIHAPILISLSIGLVIGALAQYTRFCVAGAIRNFILAFDKSLLYGLILMFIGIILTNAFVNNFEFIIPRIEFINEYVFGFLGMLVVGWASVFIGGCHFRQLVLAGEGNVNSGISILGMLFGGALVQNLSIKTTSEGVSFEGQISIYISLIILVAIGLIFREKMEG